MRFAGQRFRSQRGDIGKFRADSGRQPNMRNPYPNPTGTSAMTNMKEVNANQMAFTAMPDMSEPEFRAPVKSEQPEFRAPSRI